MPEQRIAHLPAELAPEGGFALRRIGPTYDGGYVVAATALAPTTWLLSLGLADDWRFERAFQEATGAHVTAVDMSTGPEMWAHAAVTRAYLTLRGTRFRGPGASAYNAESGYLRYRRFFADPSREHLRQWVGDGADGTVSVTDLLALRPTDSVFLKMDIEGSEWRTLADIVAQQSRFTGMAIEFHDVDLHLDRLVGFVSDLTDFAVIHVAANNAGRVTVDGVPTVVEISFARRDQADGSMAAPTSETRAALMAPNLPHLPSIELTVTSWHA